MTRLTWLAVLLFLSAQLWAGVVKSVSGDVMVDLGKGWIPAKVGMKIKNGTELMTGFDSKIVVTYEAGEFVVNELSQITFKEKASKNRVDNSLDLKLGRVRVKYQKLKSRKKTSFKVSTPRGSASVRGTEEEVTFFPDSGMRVKVLVGHVDVQTSSGLRVAVREGGEASSSRKIAIKGSADEIRNRVQGSFGREGLMKRPLAGQDIQQLINRFVPRYRDMLETSNEPERL